MFRSQKDVGNKPRIGWFTLWKSNVSGYPRPAPRPPRSPLSDGPRRRSLASLPLSDMSQIVAAKLVAAKLRRCFLLNFLSASNFTAKQETAEMIPCVFCIVKSSSEFGDTDGQQRTRSQFVSASPGFRLLRHQAIFLIVIFGRHLKSQRNPGSVMLGCASKQWPVLRNSKKSPWQLGILFH